MKVTGFNSGIKAPTCSEYTYKFEIQAPPPVIFTATHTPEQNERCYQANDGAVTLSASGGRAKEFELFSRGYSGNYFKIKVFMSM